MMRPPRTSRARCPVRAGLHNGGHFDNGAARRGRARYDVCKEERRVRSLDETRKECVKIKATCAL